MPLTMLKVLAFCLTQTALVRGFRMLSKASSTAAKSKLNMAATPEFSLPDQPARFAKAKAEGQPMSIYLRVPIAPEHWIFKSCNRSSR